MLPERIGPILIVLGILETEFRRGLFHGLLVSLDEFAHAPFEQAFDLIDIPGIFFPRDPAHAAALASSDVHFQTGAVFAAQHALARDVELARTQRIGAAEKAQQAIGIGGAAVALL